MMNEFKTVMRICTSVDASYCLAHPLRAFRYTYFKNGYRIEVQFDLTSVFCCLLEPNVRINDVEIQLGTIDAKGKCKLQNVNIE